MENKDLSVFEQFAILKGLTERMGFLHEAQVRQLKIWPRVLFESSNKSEFGVDIDAKLISFTIWEPKSSKKTSSEAPQALDANVKNLLGKAWTVKIEIIKGQKKTHHSFGPEYPV